MKQLWQKYIGQKPSNLSNMRLCYFWDKSNDNIKEVVSSFNLSLRTESYGWNCVIADHNQLHDFIHRTDRHLWHTFMIVEDQESAIFHQLPKLLNDVLSGSWSIVILNSGKAAIDIETDTDAIMLQLRGIDNCKLELYA